MMAPRLEKPMRAVALLTFVILALVPSASADANGHSSFAAGELAYDEPTNVPVTVVLGCDLVLTTGGGIATVSMEELPVWLSAAPVSVEVDPMECIPGVQGEITRELSVAVTPAADAPGLVPASINATVTYDGELQGDATAKITLAPVVVGYRPGHRISPEGDQTFTVPAAQPYSFDMTIDVLANARTMVMFEDKTLSDPSAMVNGLKAHTYDVAAGETQEKRKVTFTPPEGPWESVTVTFRTFSHCLDGTNCGEESESVVTWTFKNEAPSTAPEQNAESKGAPGASLFLVLALLVSVAAMRRRLA